MRLSVGQRFRRLAAEIYARLRRLRRPETARVKGCVKNVIVVKPSDPMFREAVFILRDDYLTGDELNRQELLLQARSAAQRYTDSLIPPVHRRIRLMEILIIVAALLLILWLTGVIQR